MTAAARVDAGRRALLAKVHLAAKDMGLQDDDRRDVIERVTGHRSSADCTEAQLVRVLDEYKRLGWKPTVVSGPKGRSKTVRRRAEGPVQGKARALWISLWNLGVVRDPSDRALEAFARRQLGVDSLQWADPSTAFRLIEALKAMAEREGWDQSVTTDARLRPPPVTLQLKRKLVVAQVKRLLALGVETAPIERGATEDVLDTLIKSLGVAIRKAQAEAED